MYAHIYIYIYIWVERDFAPPTVSALGFHTLALRLGETRTLHNARFTQAKPDVLHVPPPFLPTPPPSPTLFCSVSLPECTATSKRALFLRPRHGRYAFHHLHERQTRAIHVKHVLVELPAGPWAPATCLKRVVPTTDLALQAINLAFSVVGVPTVPATLFYSAEPQAMGHRGAHSCTRARPRPY